MNHRAALQEILNDPVKRAVLEKAAPEVFKHLVGMFEDQYWQSILDMQRAKEIEAERFRADFDRIRAEKMKWEEQRARLDRLYGSKKVW